MNIIEENDDMTEDEYLKIFNLERDSFSTLRRLENMSLGLMKDKNDLKILHSELEVLAEKIVDRCSKVESLHAKDYLNKMLFGVCEALAVTDDLVG